MRQTRVSVPLRDRIMKKRTAFLASLLLGVALCRPLAAVPVADPATAPADETKEAAYAQSIEKRTQDILAALEVSDPAKAGRAHDTLIAQYRALRDWHD